MVACFTTREEAHRGLFQKRINRRLDTNTETGERSRLTANPSARHSPTQQNQHRTRIVFFSGCGFVCLRCRIGGGRMRYVILAIGFLIAIAPTLVQGVWNGQSFLGLMIVLISAGYIFRKDYLEDVDV
jgi:hypothetical protein